MAYNVSTADIEARWRPLTTAEDEIAAVLLVDAAAKLDLKRPTLAAAVASATPATHVDERLVIMVLVDMVIRVISNPDLNRNINIGADGAIGITYALEIYRSRLGLAPGDLDAIDQALRIAGAMPSKFLGRRLSSTMNYRASSAPTTSTLPTA
jgi:hypothetical protein